MEQSRLKKDECFILVKALPHRSSKYFETVCCAGIGFDGKWRRQYPVPFRILDPRQKFGRWTSIRYQYKLSSSDKRKESQKVIPESLEVGSELKRSERAKILNPLIRNSFEEANSLQESLTLLRPQSLELKVRYKSKSALELQTQKHADLAAQMSLFDSTAKPLKPCPIAFRVEWQDSEGKNRKHTCDDWETSTAYMKFEKMYGHQEAIRILKSRFEEEYLRAGLALAFSTHSRRNVTNGTTNQWFLVGMLRVDFDKQTDLFLC